MTWEHIVRCQSAMKRIFFLLNVMPAIKYVVILISNLKKFCLDHRTYQAHNCEMQHVGDVILI
jgi:hypothetical protein